MKTKKQNTFFVVTATGKKSMLGICSTKLVQFVIQMFYRAKECFIESRNVLQNQQKKKPKLGPNELVVITSNTTC